MASYLYLTISSFGTRCYNASRKRTGYGLLNPCAFIPSTGDKVRYNDLLKITGPARENYCAVNVAMFNEMLLDSFREMNPAFRNAYPTPDFSFHFFRRRNAQFFINNARVYAIPTQAAALAA